MIIKILHFFVTRLRQKLLQRELLLATNEDPDVAEDIEDFAFQKLKKQAKKEIETNLARLMYRRKYNLPPNDPRFLDLTDEEIVYELILQTVFDKWDELRHEEAIEDNKIIYKNTDEFESINRRLEKGEDIDLESLMTSEEDWEKVDASTSNISGN